MLHFNRNNPSMLSGDPSSLKLSNYSRDYTQFEYFSEYAIINRIIIYKKNLYHRVSSISCLISNKMKSVKAN